VNALEIELDKVQTALSEQQTSSREMETELRQELGEAFGLKGRFEDRTKELDELLLAERERLDSMTGELEQSVEARNALQAEKVTLQSVVHGLKSELEDKLGRTPAEIEELMDQAVAAGERAPRRRWLRAAGLVGVGLLTGALLGGPASQFLPADLNPGSWFGARTVATSESVGLVQEATGVSSDRSGASAAEEAAGSLASGVGAELPVASVTEERGTPREAPYPSPANVVTAWAEAWSGQRVDDYLSFYSRSFVPANGADRSAWEAQRRDRVSSPASIEVSLGEIAERKLNDERVSVTFEQAYRAGSYSDRVMKTLVLVREAGTWKILSEVSEVLE
ncbi:MAG: hypothetical protein OEM62_10710, partial [Acidobacteriota bacterium]|nr:hypothetical protein [Acidobacteriota bacterium]